MKQKNKQKEKEPKQVQEDVDDQYDMVPMKKLAYKKIIIKNSGCPKNLNRTNTRTIIARLTAHIRMRVEVIYSFKLEIQQGAGKIVDNRKKLTLSPGTRRVKRLLRTVNKIDQI